MNQKRISPSHSIIGVQLMYRTTHLVLKESKIIIIFFEKRKREIHFTNLNDSQSFKTNINRRKSGKKSKESFFFLKPSRTSVLPSLSINWESSFEKKPINCVLQAFLLVNAVIEVFLGIEKDQSSIP